MSFLIIILTAVLVVDCALLVLLVLIQLPKKEAGAGMAFGSGTTDALFGAGSGNALTKITKYATGAFLGLAIVLSILQNHYYHRDTSLFKQAYEQQQSQQATGGSPSATPKSAVVPAGTNALAIPLTITSNTAPVAVPHN